MASQASAPSDAVAGLAARLHEANGRPTRVTIKSLWNLGDGFLTNLLEETREGLESSERVGRTRGIALRNRHGRGDADHRRG